jgi:hypothetical protein
MRWSGAEGRNQKLDDCRHVADGRSGCIAFPIRNRRSVHPDVVANLPLEEFHVQTTLPDVVA